MAGGGKKQFNRSVLKFNRKTIFCDHFVQKKCTLSIIDYFRRSNLIKELSPYTLKLF